MSTFRFKGYLEFLGYWLDSLLEPVWVYCLFITKCLNNVFRLATSLQNVPPLRTSISTICAQGPSLERDPLWGGNVCVEGQPIGIALHRQRRSLFKEVPSSKRCCESPKYLAQRTLAFFFGSKTAFYPRSLFSRDRVWHEVDGLLTTDLVCKANLPEKWSLPKSDLAWKVMCPVFLFVTRFLWDMCHAPFRGVAPPNARYNMRPTWTCPRLRTVRAFRAESAPTTSCIQLSSAFNTQFWFKVSWSRAITIRWRRWTQRQTFVELSISWFRQRVDRRNLPTPGFDLSKQEQEDALDSWKHDPVGAMICVEGSPPWCVSLICFHDVFRWYVSMICFAMICFKWSPITPAPWHRRSSPKKRSPSVGGCFPRLEFIYVDFPRVAEGSISGEVHGSFPDFKKLI